MHNRDEVAREVLTELEIAIRDEQDEPTIAARVRSYRDTHYPAPAAPETVTVVDHEGVPMQWTKNERGRWVTDAGHIISPDSWAHSFAERIASDARRIAAQAKANTALIDERNTAELERDEARRALEEREEHTIAWCGDGALEAPTDGYFYTADAVRQFIQYVGATSQGEGLVLANTNSALYRARHSVADAATVKRVAQAIFRDRWRGDKGMRDGVRDTYCNDARAALRALGYTIQEGEA